MQLVVFLVSPSITDVSTLVCDVGVQIFEIIGYVYQYLQLLRQVSPQEWIFKELQDIGNMEFRFAEQQPQDDYAAELAGLCCSVLLPMHHLYYTLFNCWTLGLRCYSLHS